MKYIINALLSFILIILSACTSVPTGFEENPGYALTDTNDTSLAIEAAKVLGNKPEKTVSFLINEGTEAFF